MAVSFKINKKLMEENSLLKKRIQDMEQSESERKVVEEALRESKEKYRFLAENVNDMIQLVELPSLKYIYNNPAVEKILGYSPDELMKMTCDQIVSRETMDKFYGYMQLYMENPSESQNMELPIIRKDREIVWIESTYRLIYDNAGVPVKLHTVSRDITERKKREEKLKLLLSDLQKELEEIKTLKGIVPICANCKKIRDDEGYWEQVESYLAKHTEAKFSHGICPDCMRQLYPEFCEDKKTV